MTQQEWADRINTYRSAEPDPYHSLQRFENVVTESQTISSWEEFQRWFQPFKKGGCFRGQRAAEWHLLTTLDRALYRQVKVETPEFSSMEACNRNYRENEQAALLEFQRGAHHYHPEAPLAHEVLDWLTVMQHYGAPTRLLDWTRSPYVALYFAMQGDAEGEAALWAIDFDWLESRANQLLREHDDEYQQEPQFRHVYSYISGHLFDEDNPYIIVPASPLHLNQRMLTQQGQLLCPFRYDSSFSTALTVMLLHPNVVTEQVVSRIVVNRRQRVSFLEELRRMNIHSASLFPGLDGFAHSVGENLEIAVSHQIEARKLQMLEEDRVVREWQRNRKPANKRKKKTTL